jgi:DNA-binding NtrC family response regulator
MSAQILILDDEALVCERLKEHLDKDGFQTETFTESQVALDRLASKQFDVVVTDLKMKGPSGLDVLHFVRSNSPKTEVILITGYASMEAAREAEFSGVFGFVTKPFKMDDLGRMIRRAADKAGRSQRSKS